VDVGQPRADRQHREREPVRGEDAQEAAAEEDDERGCRRPVQPHVHERPVDQESRDQEEDRHAEVEAGGEVAEPRAVVRAAQERRVREEDAQHGDRAHRVEQREARMPGRRRDDGRRR